MIRFLIRIFKGKYANKIEQNILEYEKKRK